MSVDARRPHGRSPWREAFEMLAARSSARSAVFGVTEERGPGGIVVPLLRAEIPVCPEWPTAEKAFIAAVEFEKRWNNCFRVYPAIEAEAAERRLEAAVSPPEPLNVKTNAVIQSDVPPAAQGRRKARA